MDWSAIGAMGEVGGALVVAITLVLLVRQLGISTRASNSAATSSYMQAYSQVNLVLGEPERARIVRLGMDDPSALSSDEAQSFWNSFCAFLALWESLFAMRQTGTVDEAHWLVGRNDMAAFCATQGGKEFFEEFLPFYDSAYPDFAHEIRACLSEGGLYKASKSLDT